MKKVVFKILWLLLGLGIVIGLCVLIVFSAQKKKEQPCLNCTIKVERKGAVYLQESDIQQWIEKAGIHWENSKVGEMNTSMIEKIIEENPYVRDAQVFFTPDAVLHLIVEQRKPFLRIYAPFPFYIDEDGKPMPVNNYYPQRLRICTMEVKPKANILKKIHRLEVLIRKDTLLDALIDQMHVNGKGIFELTPKVGTQRIIVGSSERMEEKLEMLNLFYRKGMPICGWEKYAIINLEYKGQIVCTKR